MSTFSFSGPLGRCQLLARWAGALPTIIAALGFDLFTCLLLYGRMDVYAKMLREEMPYLRDLVLRPRCFFLRHDFALVVPWTFSAPIRLRCGRCGQERALPWAAYIGGLVTIGFAGLFALGRRSPAIAAALGRPLL